MDDAIALRSEGAHVTCNNSRNRGEKSTPHYDFQGVPVDRGGGHTYNQGVSFVFFFVQSELRFFIRTESHPHWLVFHAINKLGEGCGMVFSFFVIV